jgi:DNA repair exonuclease SbcCD ATPase subunit
MMNQLLVQMLAARGGAANPMLANLMARMQSSADSPGMNVEELLAQQAQTNPMAAMLMKQMAEQNARAEEEKARVIDVQATATVEQVEEPVDASLATLCELRENAKVMQAELERLRERSDALAAAVGACPLCWGQSLDCRGCRGRGGPGFCTPDESLFEELILPAVRTLRAQRAGARNSLGPAQRV